MDVTWWVLLLVGITFFTLWSAGAFKKKSKEDKKSQSDD